MELVLNGLLETKEAGLKSLDEIDAIGHRIVQGGDTFSKAVLVDDAVYNKIEEYGAMAPLHNPAHLKGIDACSKVMPGKPQGNFNEELPLLITKIIIASFILHTFFSFLNRKPLFSIFLLL